MDEKTPASARRQWRSEDRAKVSIMQVFRASFHEHDARRARGRTAEGDSEITQRSRQRRDGVSEDLLRAHLEADLNALLNTIRLDAAVSLDDAPHVARSILNYGFRDLSSVSASELAHPRIVESIRQSLLDHEPRLVPGTLEIRIRNGSGMNDKDQRLSIVVQAELMGDPVDIPLDFDADVDLGAGKMKMSKLRVRM
jgi:type VI secretion system protein ImpF